jgi:3-phosphoshikimate 1-carboxyvinyltransferase
MRLLAGVLAAQSFESELTGDASLSSRPMDRIAVPLRQMGADITLQGGHSPVRIRPAGGLQGITYKLPVPSAQVKSCVLLAGLWAEGPTTVVETVPSRDHTERMLGLDIVDLGGERWITIEPNHEIPADAWTIPRDFSAAAFFLVAASVIRNAAVSMPAVGLNPSRTGALDVLRAMGAQIDVSNERTRGGEPIGDLEARSAELVGVTISGPVVPRLIDEIPILAVVGACAAGNTSIRDAEELRHKESDRIATTASLLSSMGANVSETRDGLEVKGGASLNGARLDSHGDHRIAMAAGVAALAASGETTILEAECADISYPDFWNTLKRAAGQID